MDGEDVAKLVKVINNLQFEAFTEAEISRAKLPSSLEWSAALCLCL
jgi:hypothetical protein